MVGQRWSSHAEGFLARVVAPGHSIEGRRAAVKGRSAFAAGGPHHVRLTHPDLGFWVDVTVREHDGRCMATPDLAEDSRDVGVGDTPLEAVRAALRIMGEPYASEMAAGGAVVLQTP